MKAALLNWYRRRFPHPAAIDRRQRSELGKRAYRRSTADPRTTEALRLGLANPLAKEA